MNRAGGILGIVGGILGLIAAAFTLMIGGLGSAFESSGASTVTSLGWGGVLFSLIAVVFGSLAFAGRRWIGVLLIVDSLLGIVLGGTLVAVCMLLVLAGGVLASLGRRSTAENVTSVPSSQRTPSWILAAVLAPTLLAAAKDAQSAAGRLNSPEELAQATPAAIAPDGQLAELFSFGSRGTDIQRENALKQLTGQLVSWRLPVFDVKRDGKGYKVQTRSGAQVGTFVHITPRTDAERQTVEALKTGDAIAFRGVIKGAVMRNLVIAPAILEAATAPPRAGSPNSPAVPPPPAVAGPTIQWRSYVGMHPYEMVTDRQVRAALRGPLGDRYKEFSSGFEVGSTVELVDDRYLFASGCAPRMCGSYESLLIVDSRTGKLAALFALDGPVEFLVGGDMELPPAVMRQVREWTAKF